MLKRNRFPLFVLSLSAAAASLLSSPDASADDEPFDCARPLNLVESRAAYRKFKPNDIVLSADGYGIYTDVNIPKDMLTVEDGGAMSLDLRLTSGRPSVDKVLKAGGGLWYAIRREFLRPISLQQMKGIELTVTVLKPSRDIYFKFVLADLPNSGSNKDALWSQLDPVLSLKATGTTTINIPFRTFTLNYARMSPHRYLTRRRIIAYELSFTGIGSAEVRINSVKCY